MELKKRFNFRNVFFGIYVLSFLVYLTVGFLPAEATNYIVDTKLKIPSINLVSDVTVAKLEDGKLDVPGKIVGSFSQNNNKTLLIGHSTTVFENLDAVKLYDKIIYHDRLFEVTTKTLFKKEEISMNKLLKATEKNTLVIMTCAGELLDNFDATHRLIVIAVEL